MEDIKYGIAVAEVLDILDNTDENDVKKIPVSFIDFLKSIADSNYVVSLDHSKSLDEMNLKDETKGILGAIYRNWWCSKEEKEYYNELAKKEKIEIEEEKRAKYNTDNLFKTKLPEKKSNKATEKVTAMTEYKEGFFTKIINRIKRFFNINN